MKLNNNIAFTGNYKLDFRPCGQNCADQKAVYNSLKNIKEHGDNPKYKDIIISSSADSIGINTDNPQMSITDYDFIKDGLLNSGASRETIKSLLYGVNQEKNRETVTFSAIG
ncbi:MAG: hypothetical protein WCK67_02235 [bacterium]